MVVEGSRFGVGPVNIHAMVGSLVIHFELVPRDWFSRFLPREDLNRPIPSQATM